MRRAPHSNHAGETRAWSDPDRSAAARGPQHRPVLSWLPWRFPFSPLLLFPSPFRSVGPHCWQNPAFWGSALEALCPRAHPPSWAWCCCPTSRGQVPLCSLEAVSRSPQHRASTQGAFREMPGLFLASLFSVSVRLCFSSSAPLKFDLLHSNAARFHTPVVPCPFLTPRPFCFFPL